MNHTAVINIRTDISVKRKAQTIAKNLGLNLSALINGYLKQLIRTRTVVFSTREEPSEYLIKSLEQSKKDIKKGFVSPSFDNAKDADEWLDDPKAKYANQIQSKV
jgi:addiction module RelB/DinJ family antitoxin